MKREGRPGRADKEGRTHTHTHTHTRHLVTPVQKELVHVVLRIVPAKRGGGGQGGKCEERRGGRLTRTERWGSDEVVFFLVLLLNKLFLVSIRQCFLACGSASS